MNLRKTLATGAAALMLGAGLATAPALLASPSSGLVAEADAALGWGGTCGSYLFKRSVNENWWAEYRQYKRWWTDSLTGTTCRNYGSPVFVRYVHK